MLRRAVESEPGRGSTSCNISTGGGGSSSTCTSSRAPRCALLPAAPGAAAPRSLWMSKRPPTGWPPSRIGSCGSLATMAITRVTPARKVPPDHQLLDVNQEPTAPVHTVASVGNCPLFLSPKILLLLFLNFRAEDLLEFADIELKGRTDQGMMEHRLILRTAAKKTESRLAAGHARPWS